MPEFSMEAEIKDVRLALRKAKELGEDGSYFYNDALHIAVYDARQSGWRRSEVAAALNVPVRDVWRHWWSACCLRNFPTFHGEPMYEALLHRVWEHNPNEISERLPCPFEWDYRVIGDMFAVQVSRRRTGRR